LCSNGNDCLQALFFEQNQNKGRAKTCVGPVCQWGTTGSGARMVGAGALAGEVEEVIGNRGTGLTAGDWKLDGGVWWHGMNLDSGFKMFLTVHSISNSVVDVSISESSVVFGSNLPGFSHLKFQYGSISWGLFGKKDGYLYEGELCSNGNDCLQALFFEQNQNKGRAKTCVGPVCQWGTTGNGTQPQ